VISGIIKVEGSVISRSRRLACVASVSVGFGSKELQREKWSEIPLFLFFGSRPIFRADKTPKIPFLGLSLLPNPTETLATQASRRLRLITLTETLIISGITNTECNNCFIIHWPRWVVYPFKMGQEFWQASGTYPTKIDPRPLGRLLGPRAIIV